MFHVFCFLYIGKTCYLTGYANKQFEFEFDITWVAKFWGYDKKKNGITYMYLSKTDSIAQRNITQKPNEINQTLTLLTGKWQAKSSKVVKTIWLFLEDRCR